MCILLHRLVRILVHRVCLKRILLDRVWLYSVGAGRGVLDRVWLYSLPTPLAALIEYASAYTSAGSHVFTCAQRTCADRRHMSAVLTAAYTSQALTVSCAHCLLCSQARELTGKRAHGQESSQARGKRADRRLHLCRLSPQLYSEDKCIG